MRVAARSRALAALVPALTLAAGCGRKHRASEEPKAGEPAAPAPTVSERPPEEDETAGRPRKMTVDEKIKEALKKVDPVVLYERVPVPDEKNAFPLWRDASALYEEFRKGREGDDPFWDAFLDSLRSDRDFPSGEAGEAITAWIDRHRKALPLVDEGIARGRCQFPELKGLDDKLWWLAPLRGFARLRVLKAKKLAGTGEFRAASRELRRVVRMGEMIQDGEGALIHCLVGIAVEGIGTGGVRWLASKEAVPESVFEDLIAGLRPVANPGAGLACSLRWELRGALVPCTRQMLQRLNIPERKREITPTLLDEVELPKEILALFEQFRGSPGVDLVEAERRIKEILAPLKQFEGSAGVEQLDAEGMLKLTRAPFEHFKESAGVELVDVGDTFQTACAFYARIIRNARSSWKNRDRRIDRDIGEYRTTLYSDLGKAIGIELFAVVQKRNLTDAEAAAIRIVLPNPVGRGLVTLVMPALDAANERAFRTRADRAATRAILALRLREMRKGVLPDSLRALVEERMLASVPVDPFSDRPLRYSREGRVVWSVGADETDDGGRDQPGTWRGKDYVWRVPGGP